MTTLTVRWWHPVKYDLGEWGWVRDIDPTGQWIKVVNDEESVWIEVEKAVSVIEGEMDE